jgi:predicted ATPase/class 3 adenylate cyclase/Tfp pilus assembly protein PilF
VADLPGGTVTFLFTDVEGSTLLLHELGHGYADVLAEHRRVLRDAFRRHGGVEVDTQGDAFFVAFARASDGLAAAAEARDTLAHGPIRVRMGLHTGEPLVTEEGYVGIDVHRAARIASAGHGGQILVSQSTRELVDADGLRDLGEHRLKDLTAPERIYQLGDSDFPPLKSLNRTNLPVAATPLVGREHELEHLRTLLADGARLVTLTGPGGTGKTRLALQVAAELADDFRDGVFFVPLAPLQDAALVEPALLQTVGMRSIEELSQTESLLVLDNFEHLLLAATVVSTILGRAPAVKVLATSRVRLRLQGEEEFAVEPLPPDDAVTFFVERARSLGSGVEAGPAVAEICRRLDGLPLALELAASRMKIFDADGLLRRLQQRLPLLTGGARDLPERQRTLRATIEWTYELLDSDLQRALRRLSVFAGSFSLDAAEQVAGTTLDDLATLVDWSLVKAVGNERFLLLETIREYAAQLLAASGKAEDLRQRHLTFFLDLVVTAEPELAGGNQKHWYDRLALDEDNVREALAYACESGDGERALLLSGSNWRFWHLRAQMIEALQWYDRAFAVGGEVSLRARARAVYAMGEMERNRGNRDRARALLEEAIPLLRAAEESRWVVAALNHLANAKADAGEWESARSTYEEALEIARDTGNERATAMITGNLGFHALGQGRDAEAEALLRQAAEVDRRLGAPIPIAQSLVNLALLSLRRDDTPAAAGQLGESLALYRSAQAEVGAFEALLLAAAVVGRRGDARPSVRLQAAGRTLAAARAYELSALELELADAALAAARDSMPDDIYADEWLRGEQLDVDTAISLALKFLG